ncbi:gibberellin 3-beta-dioxygenase 1-like [Pyrus communis]|uniref:gibberellin 3-beta-dioxygenase 1-like n=1 Tax=Pyrus communis TaxID=23211 RepID=UPI0035C1C214
MPASASAGVVPDAYEGNSVNVVLDKVPDDFNSLHELPDSYAWTTLNEHPSLESDSVPVVDLNDPNSLQLLGHACKTWGVFQLTNHGIPQSLVHAMDSAARSLFSLPAQQKLKVARSPGQISGYGFHLIAAFWDKQQWSECFTIVGSPLEHYAQLWPQDYTKFCCITEEFEREIKRLASRLMWLMLASLGISKDDVEWDGPKGDDQNASAVFQFNSYPSCPDPDRTLGLVPHTDSSLVSIVHQSNIDGLQVFREGTGWFTIQPVPGALVINVGDLMSILSNGLYSSVLHRVLVKRAQHRISLVYHYGPPAAVKIAPLAKLVGPSHPPLYPPVTNWNEYISTKAKLKGKALPSLRLYDPLMK